MNHLRFLIRLTCVSALLSAGSLFACLLGGCGPLPQAAPRTSGPSDASAIRFEEVTESSGLRFVHQNGSDGRFLMPELLGSGGAFLDYDGDGRLDLFLVNGASWPGRPPSKATPALYRNLNGSRFRDVTQEAGLAVAMQGMGCSVGDFDNDGREDLFVSCVGPNRLFRNEGGRFRDVTAGSGLGGGPRWAWHTAATWFDYDRDGFLDLFVTRYVRWSPETDIPCTTGGKRTYCGPLQYHPDTFSLFRNLGNGTFRDVSRSAGIADRPGKGLGAIPHDINHDGYPDLVVANDLVPNHLFLNEKGVRFRDRADEFGISVGPTAEPRAGMGIDIADIRNDGTIALAIGNFSGEGLALFSEGEGFFEDLAVQNGLMAPSLKILTFGLCFLDADLDGRVDLFAFNGHVNPLVSDTGAATEWKQRPLLFRNLGQGRYGDVTPTAGAPFEGKYVGRGCAWGDLDDDGRPDLLLCENNGPARLLRNVSETNRHWLGVRVVGSKRGGKMNRSGYGTEVRLTAGGITQRRWVRSGGSYLSHSDTRALFGLGDAATVEKLEIRCPNGTVTTHPVTQVDHYMTVEAP